MRALGWRRTADKYVSRLGQKSIVFATAGLPLAHEVTFYCEVRVQTSLQARKVTLFNKLQVPLARISD
jgi:hypothetical protein